MSVLRRVLAAAFALALLVPALLTSAGPPSYAAQGSAKPRAALEKRVIGHSVQGRPIVAWHLGDSDARRRVLLMSTMHGDEKATHAILTGLRDGRRIRSIDLWVLPVYNPDGFARGTRTNDRGVDLNRNFPHAWADLDGRYESGTGPASEPETQAVMAFVAEIRPDRVLSFHQPLYGVDTDSKSPGFATRVARALHLPRTRLSCGGVCHGTMTGWFNATFPGTMLTVEYGARPARRTMTRDAPRQVLAVLGARRAGDRRS